jgi:hypothetical protein
MHVGNNKTIQNDDKCSFNDKKFKIIKETSIKDFKIALIQNLK